MLIVLNYASLCELSSSAALYELSTYAVPYEHCQAVLSELSRYVVPLKLCCYAVLNNSVVIM